MRVHMPCTTLHVAVKTENACCARHHYMHFTSPRFAVGIHIPRRRVVLEVGFSRPCGNALIRSDVLCNTSGLTAPGSLNTCPMCEEQRWIFNICTIVRGTMGLQFRSRLKKLSNLGLKARWSLFVNLAQQRPEPPAKWLAAQALPKCTTQTLGNNQFFYAI